MSDKTVHAELAPSPISVNRMQQISCELNDPATWKDWKGAEEALPILVENFAYLDPDKDGRFRAYEMRDSKFNGIPEKVWDAGDSLYEQLRRYQHYKNCNLTVSKDTLQFMKDSNESGFTQKLVEERARQTPYKSFVGELRKNFDTFDQNHDGKISREEVDKVKERTDLTVAQTVNASYLDNKFGTLQILSDDDNSISRKTLDRADKVADGDWLFLPHTPGMFSSYDPNGGLGIISGMTLTFSAYAIVSGGEATAATTATAAAMSTTATAMSTTATAMSTTAAILGSGAVIVGGIAVAAGVGVGVEYLFYKHDRYEDLQKQLLAQPEPIERRIF
jgi:hypothetical protein